MYRLVIALAFTASTIAATAGAEAQTANKPKEFTYAKADDVGKKDEVEWKASAQAGLALASGNSKFTNFTAGALASRKSKGNKFQLEGSAAFARAGTLTPVDGNGNMTIDSDEEIVRVDTTTSRAWALKARYDRFLTENNSLYLAGTVGGDKLAGKELIGGGQAGYSRVLLNHKSHKVVGEAGYDFTYEDLVGDTNLSIHSLRGFLGYAGKVSEDNTSVDASLEALFNLNKLEPPGGDIDRFEDVRLLGKLGIATKLADNVNFRFGFELRFDNAPAPLPAFAVPYADGFVPLADELDTKAEAALIVSFL